MATTTTDSSSNTGVVAVVAILVIVLIAGFLAYRNGMFGGTTSATRVNVELKAPENSPKPTENPAPADTPHSLH